MLEWGGRVGLGTWDRCGEGRCLSLRWQRTFGCGWVERYTVVVIDRCVIPSYLIGEAGRGGRLFGWIWLVGLFIFVGLLAVWCSLWRGVVHEALLPSCCLSLRLELLEVDGETLVLTSHTVYGVQSIVWSDIWIQLHDRRPRTNWKDRMHRSWILILGRIVTLPSKTEDGFGKIQGMGKRENR